ncbi:KAT8 regulatory NSL complex subunit 3-like [Dreissena polymorpha]|uniref:KAT8 regulatory NSL complex subunit 3 n=1 Tax=Dreissena polymorpha TaxID=45954 RepID=A0A9D4F3U4_DREPO|nr:KAT8 regulatory NSL complex subunit 3-like [Dreissena polymorpha]KAH3789566.1 hypothetical protein DPMN_167748 [Dreissena polymorpha]
MALVGLDIVSVDHCYSKPWSAHPDASNARPVRMLYMEKFPRNKSLDQAMPEPDILLDVVSVPTQIPAIFETGKSHNAMSDVEKQLSALHDDRGDEWEDNLNRSGWTPQQSRIFSKINKILVGDRLSKLANAGNINESVTRRNQINKTAKRVRHVLATCKWNPKLVKWLHGVLLDNLGVQSLATYIEVLQTLKAKIPSLIETMTSVGGLSIRAQQLSGDTLTNMIKKTWDPIHTSYSQMKLKKLPGNPLILIAPSGPTGPNSVQSKRQRYWSSQLAGLGKVIPVLMHMVSRGSGVSIAQCLEHMIVAVKDKVTELKAHFLNRPIVLLGWNIGALVASHVSLQESVSAVVCLGFPYTGVGGGRGDADDPLLDCRTPTLFVIGQHANTCSVDDMEDMREKMRAENSLIVVGGADDNLRMSRSKRKLEAVTQVMVDKSILDEISEFIGGVLSQSPVLQESVIVDLADLDGRKARADLSRDDHDGDVDFTTQTNLEQMSDISPGRLSIAKALRARALSGSQQTPGSDTPVRVKRKYTKRKGVTNPLDLPTPKKRYRSTPTPPIQSPVPSVQTPLSAGNQPAFSVAPELTGLLRGQPGLLPSFRILTDESGHKTAVFSSQPSTVSTATPFVSSVLNLQLAATSGADIGSATDAPLVAYRLEDYEKKFPDANQPSIKTTISIEGLLRSQQPLSSPAPLTSTPISSLLSLARQMPGNIPTSSVSSQIQQLLSTLARSHMPTSVIPPQLHSPAIVVSQQAVVPPSTISYSVSQSGSITQIQMNQSGSPLQNSVPTLMSSLTKCASTSLIKRMTSLNSDQSQATVTSPSPILTKTDLTLPITTVSSVPMKNILIEETIDLTKSDEVDTDILMESKSREASPAMRNAGVQSPIHIISRPIISIETPNQVGLKQSQPATVMCLSTKTSTALKPGLVMSQTFTAQKPGPVISQATSINSPLLQIFPLKTTEEPLGQVSSLLESSPITQSATQSHTLQTCASQWSSEMASDVSSVSVAVALDSTLVCDSVSVPNVVASNTLTPKPNITATTRTRKIRTPKQFDL